MKKDLRIKVREGRKYGDDEWDYGIYEGKEYLMGNTEHRSGEIHWRIWFRKTTAIRNAKAMAKRLGIKYDPEIIKL